jgi:hypothetical protein
MKIFIALTLISGIATAQTSNSNSGANSSQSQGLNSSGNSSLNYQTTSYGPYIPVASSFAAPLTSGLDTCMGSSSGGAAGPGFSLSVGSTWSDKNCLMLKNAREMWNMGLKDAAFARMCMDADNREAVRISGGTCPQDRVYGPKEVKALPDSVK